MRIQYAFIWLALLVMLVGCGAKKAEVDYDPGYALNTLRTYAFADANVEGISALDEQRVKNALASALHEKHYAAADTKPDFTVSYHVVRIDDVPSNVSLGFGFGGGSAHTGIGVGATKQLRHDEAMLEVRMTDPGTGKVFWTVSFRTRIDADASPQTRESRINETVRNMLDSFPEATP